MSKRDRVCTRRQFLQALVRLFDEWGIQFPASVGRSRQDKCWDFFRVLQLSLPSACAASGRALSLYGVGRYGFQFSSKRGLPKKVRFRSMVSSSVTRVFEDSRGLLEGVSDGEFLNRFFEVLGLLVEDRAQDRHVLVAGDKVSVSLGEGE